MRNASIYRKRVRKRMWRDIFLNQKGFGRFFCARQECEITFPFALATVVVLVVGGVVVLVVGVVLFL